jgi:hypothetical protein
VAELNEKQLDDIVRQQLWGAKRIAAWFTLQPVRNTVESEKQGFPVYDERPYIMVLKDDERDHVSVPATADHIRQFPAEWQRFRENIKSPRMPLQGLPGINPASIAALNELGIFTIEDLVAAEITTDRVLQAREITDEMIDQDLDYLGDIAPKRAVPATLARWRDVAMHYIVFRAKASGKTPPTLRLFNGHYELATVTPATAEPQIAVPDVWGNAA